MCVNIAFVNKHWNKARQAANSVFHFKSNLKVILLYVCVVFSSHAAYGLPHIWKILLCLAGSWDEVTVPEKQCCFCLLCRLMTLQPLVGNGKVKHVVGGRKSVHKWTSALKDIYSTFEIAIKSLKCLLVFHHWQWKSPGAVKQLLRLKRGHHEEIWNWNPNEIDSHMLSLKRTKCWLVTQRATVNRQARMFHIALLNDWFWTSVELVESQSFWSLPSVSAVCFVALSLFPVVTWTSRNFLFTVAVVCILYEWLGHHVEIHLWR